MILKTKKQTLVFKTSRPRVTAHLLRQAFTASKIADNQYKDFKDTWRVKEQTGCIILVRKSEVEEAELLEETSIEAPEEIESIKDSGIPVPSVTRIEEVIGAILNNTNKALTFPKFHPTSQELAVLDRWGKSYKVMFHYTNNLLTVRPTDE